MTRFSGSIFGDGGVKSGLESRFFLKSFSLLQEVSRPKINLLSRRRGFPTKAGSFDCVQESALLATDCQQDVVLAEGDEGIGVFQGTKK